MQKTHFFDLLPQCKDNLLYQCGYMKGMSLFSLLQTNQSTVLNMLPFWIVLRRMTASQLHRFCLDVGLQLPKTCTKTRESLYYFILPIYEKWDAVLNDPTTEVSDLITAFNYIDDWENVSEAKAFFRERIKLMIPGNEILVM